LADRGIDLEYTENVINLVAKEGYDPVYGARPLKRFIQKRLQDTLAMSILKGEIKDGEKIVVDIDKKGDLTFKSGS